MPFLRRRPLLRAAMVGGVAYHAGRRAQEGREAEYDRDARIAELEERQATAPAPAPPAPAPAPPAPEVDLVEQLERLGRLKEQGILTAEEFAAQKQKLLAGVS
jgi:hypothetical protein